MVPLIRVPEAPSQADLTARACISDEPPNETRAVCGAGFSVRKVIEAGILGQFVVSSLQQEFISQSSIMGQARLRRVHILLALHWHHSALSRVHMLLAACPASSVLWTGSWMNCMSAGRNGGRIWRKPCCSPGGGCSGRPAHRAAVTPWRRRGVMQRWSFDDLRAAHYSFTMFETYTMMCSRLPLQSFDDDMALLCMLGPH